MMAARDNVVDLPVRDAPTKALLAKWRFAEHLAVLAGRGHLTAVQMAVAIRLLSLTNAHRGYAWPSYEQLAADVGASRSKVAAALVRLKALGLFEIASGGGRRRANEYRPCWGAIPDGCPFDVAAETVPKAGRFKGKSATEETVPFLEETVPFLEETVPHGWTPSDRDSSGLDSNRSVATALSGESGPSDQGKPSRSSATSEQARRSPPRASKPSQAETDQKHVDAMLALWEDPLPPGTLNRVERAFKAGVLERLSQTDLLRLNDQLELIAEVHEHQSGGPIGGFAERLRLDVWEHIALDESGVPDWPDGYWPDDFTPSPDEGL